MKLSELEKMVKAMKASAKHLKDKDPEVIFWTPVDEENKARDSGQYIRNYEPTQWDESREISVDRCVSSLTSKRGDFHLTLKFVDETELKARTAQRKSGE